jgi:hypothetical protein
MASIVHVFLPDSGFPGFRHAPFPRFLVGIDPRRAGVPALGRANYLGTPNPSRSVGGLRGVHSTSPISIDFGRLVIEPFHIPDIKTTLRHFSLPAPDETMAPLSNHERDQSLSGIK